MVEELERRDTERLVRIEEGIKSCGRSIDQLRDSFNKHAAHEEAVQQAVEERLDSIENDLAKAKGGGKVLLWVMGILPATGALVWGAITWLQNLKS